MSPTQAQIRSELHTVAELLRADFSYRVPVHQRDFSWTLEEVSQLWDDLMEALREGRMEYFLGTTVVTEDRDEKIRSVIDGQQRLATLTMVLAAIRSEYSEHGDAEGASDIQRDYLGTRDKRSKTIEPKLTMNRTNESVFQQYVVDHVPLEELKNAGKGKKLPPSNTLLLKAATFIREAVREKVTSSKSYESFLLELEELIKDRVILIVVAAGDEADAYLIFETLNDRGLELSISDLLKNYIYGRAGAKRLGVVQKQWEETIVILGTQDATQFLRHYWLSKYGVVRERELYRELRKKFASEMRVLSLMGELREAADKYAAISSVDHSTWKGQGTQVRRDLEALQLFSLKQFRPLLLAALDSFDPKQIAAVIKMIVVISVRYSLIGQLGTGNIEKAYSDAAMAIRDGKAKSAAQVFSSVLKSVIYPDDASFSAAFGSRALTTPKIARYMLAQIENSLNPATELEVVQDEKKVNLEHIMPKSQSSEWSGAAEDEDEYLSNVDRIGNMTLIESDVNSAAGNASFSKKKAAFSKSGLQITKQVNQYNRWTVDEIRHRQEALAKTAVKVWSLPY